MIQKYYSEELNKYFDTEEECINAEKENEKKLALEKAKKAERKERAEEVEKAFKEADEAYKVAREKLNEFVKDYGAWHQSYKNTLPSRSLFDIFFGDNFFNF